MLSHLCALGGSDCCGEADGGPVPCAQRLADVGIGRQGQEAACRDHAPFMDDQGTVMDRRGWNEDAANQFSTDTGIKARPHLDVLVQADFTLQDDERAGALAGERDGGAHDFFDVLLFGLGL